MSLTRHQEAKPVDMFPGVVRRTMTDGERMMLCEVSMEKGSVVPRHTHPHEQTGWLASGRLRLEVAGESRDLGPGDAWMIPGGVPHAAEALEASVFVDVFSPPREEYR